MRIEPSSSAFNHLDHVRQGSDKGASYIEKLYQFLFQPNPFVELWSMTGANSEIILDIAQAIEDHLNEWNTKNAETNIEWQLKDDGEGWIGLEPALEQNEFTVLQRVWQLSQDSVTNKMTDADFFQAAAKMTDESLLFSALRGMQVVRTNGKVKKVWPHIENVVSSLHSEELTDFGDQTAIERQAIVRFTAFVHDIFNVVAIDNDWLQLHAHGGAALIYRFLVKKMTFTPEKAASIVRVIDLHHILQLQKIDGVVEMDRVVDPQEAAAFFASIPNGLEELSRLLWFSLADVGQSFSQFRAEHITAALGLLNLLIEADGATQQERKIELSRQAIIEGSKIQARLSQEVDLVELEKVPLFKGLINELSRRIEALVAFIKNLGEDAPDFPPQAILMTLSSN